ncbi:formimidoylglutamate deiminase [Actinocatenispora rupis]|uniref:Formimidoylglutamate deiminase n=1 Tax=Actinocatenispora rupis TaxID=519421 RepID=A0A8J3J5P0_9ACTN|nr:formimidoylglutamate deiminase [Actinocatenispora rupis]GID10602.1 formimidoylglutamate deiminase [Actinocatenispora rupis]
MTARYWCPMLWTGEPGPGSLLRDALVTVRDGTIAAIERDRPAPPDAVRLAGITLPGLANAHSHAFHRALRGRTHADRGSFWTWREQMYRIAAVLTPDTYLALARAAYAEMALAGITVVGEFHYLHHAPGGKPYDEPNVMGAALAQAAADAGIRLVLADTCYLNGGLDERGALLPLQGAQLRFGDGTAEAWAERAAAFRPPHPDVTVAKAIHSVRAMPPDAMRVVAGAPFATDLHVHLSEQRAENAACQAAYGLSPTQLLGEAGALGPRSLLVHATHLSPADRDLIADLGAGVCLCPTTERDLGDGIGPAPDLHAARPGSLSLGSDSHAVVDPFEEARAVELNERLRSERRGHFAAADLLYAAGPAGRGALGRTPVLVPGADADLTTVRTDTVRLAGADLGTDADALGAVVFAATAADVRHVVVAGREVVRDGVHQLVEDVPGRLDRAVRAVWAEAAS